MAAMNDDAVTPEAKALLGEILGQLVIEYGETSYASTLDGSTATDRYEVMGEGTNWVDVRAYSHLDQSVTVRRIWVEGDRMWVRISAPKATFNEYFVRLSD